MDNWNLGKFKRIRFIVFISILFLPLFGCFQHNKIIKESEPPIRFNSKTEKIIDIEDIQLDQSLMNKVIGYFHEGYPFIKPVTYYGYHAKFPKSVYLADLKAELINANYPIPESNISVFNNSRPQRQAEILIGGTITQINFDSYSYLSGRSSEAKVIVKWEVYDIQYNKIIYNQETSGWATGPMSLTEAQVVTVVGAVQSSFKKILSNKEFANSLCYSLKDNPEDSEELSKQDNVVVRTAPAAPKASAQAMIQGSPSINLPLDKSPRQKINPKNIIVKYDSIKIYDQPGHSNIISFRNRGAILSAVEENDNWYMVEFAPGKTGWVAKDWVSAE